jgi:polyhydroxyalkanoate synthesis regulator phasin
VRDTVAEMAAKAHEISMEAGSKMAAAMKEVIGAAAGLSTFTLESARDLVQYMVRRGQMTQDEADRLIREAEDAWSKKHKGKKPPPRLEPKVAPKSIVKPVPYSLPKAAVPAVVPKKAAAPAGKAAAHKPAARKPAGKSRSAKPAKKAAKKATRPAAKKAAKKKPAPKK